MESKKLKRVLIKEELVALTGDFKLAIILNQMIYWSERIKDFDKFIEEEKKRCELEDTDSEMELQNGWIYKTAEDLAEETLIGISASNMRTQIKKLISAGFISERTNPKFKWDRTKQYRVDIMKIQRELLGLGYALEGYSLDGLFSSSSETENASEENEKSNHPKQKIEVEETENRTTQNERAITETTTEITTETTTHNKKEIEGVVCVLDKKIKFEEAKKLLEIANGDIGIIKEKYEIAKTTGYRTLMGFMIKAIRENWQMSKSKEPEETKTRKKVDTGFHNFKGRTSEYSPEELDKRVSEIRRKQMEQIGR